MAPTHAGSISYTDPQLRAQMTDGLNAFDVAHQMWSNVNTCAQCVRHTHTHTQTHTILLFSKNHWLGGCFSGLQTRRRCSTGGGRVFVRCESVCSTSRFKALCFTAAPPFPLHPLAPLHGADSQPPPPPFLLANWLNPPGSEALIGRWRRRGGL